MDEENTLFPWRESPEFIDDGDQLDRDYHYTVAWDVENRILSSMEKGRWSSAMAWKGIKYGVAKWLLHSDMTAQLIQTKLELN